jgi:hypothetical protein
LNFVKGFFCIYWDDDVVFVLDSVYLLYLGIWPFYCVVGFC